jgi:HK97 gp10 family phage protein
MKTLKGGPELLQVLGQFPENIERNVLRGGLRAGAKPIQQRAKALVRRKSGKVAKSIVVGSRVEEGQPRGYVKLKGPHSFVGVFLEWGVRAHLIKVSDEDRAKLGKMTRRGFRRFGMRMINKMARLGSLVIGRDFVGPVVDHPGHAPMPFMRPAMDQGATEAIQAMGGYIAHRVDIGDIKAPRLDVEETE